MSEPPAPPTPSSPAPSSPLAEVRALVAQATHQLLGDSIAVSDEQWRAPSRLPGWSRGHVATHLARQADGQCRLVSWALTGDRLDMYPSPQARETDIEAGAGRPGLELQVDLDTSAERLTEAFASLDESEAGWDADVEVRGGQRVPARLLPLGRLTEVVLHHVDLDLGFTMADVPVPTAEWLIEWSALRLSARDGFPRVELTTDSGFHTTLGSSGAPLTVTGPAPLVLGWLTGRTSPDDVPGTDGLVLPGL